MVPEQEPPDATREIKTSRLESEEFPLAQPRAPKPTSPLATPWRLLVQILGEGQTTLGLEVSDSIIIGRADPNENFKPTLDLTPYGGISGGVSRRHAVIRHQDGVLFLEDLNSTNGTRLNGGELKPGQLYRLRHGDEIELGEVKMTIRFIQVPQKQK